jgi:hypothetical protein
VHADSRPFYSEGSGNFHDLFRQSWNVAQQIEKLDPAEMQRRHTDILEKNECKKSRCSPSNTGASSY